MTVAAVIVTYNPDQNFEERLAAIARECAPVYIVDNGSANQASLKKVAKKHRAHLIALEYNTGIAHAQNVGLATAFRAGAAAVVLFDHDSLPRPGFVAALLAASQQRRLAGPRVYDIHKKAFALHPCRTGLFFRRRAVAENAILESSLMVIASGCLVPRSVYEATGGMRDELFIDYVDWEFCLRAWHNKGIETVVAGKAVLEHARGERKGKKFGPFTVFPPGYSAFRYRQIFLNRARLLRTYFFRDRAFVAFEVVALLRDFGLILFEQYGWSSLWMALKSWFSGLSRPIR